MPFIHFAQDFHWSMQIIIMECVYVHINQIKSGIKVIYGDYITTELTAVGSECET